MKVLAVSDTHVSDRITLGGASPTVDGRPLVLEQARRALAWVRDTAVKHEVDLVLHGGDVYDEPRPSPAAEAVVVDWLIEMTEIAPTIVLVGNHDRPSGGGTHALEPVRNLAPDRLIVADDADPVFLLPAVGRTWSRVTRNRSMLRASDDAELVVFPIPYPDKARARAAAVDADAANLALSGGLEAVLADCAQQTGYWRLGGTPCAILMHGTLRGASFGSRVAPLSDVQVPAAQWWPAFDLHACGHIHQRQACPGRPDLPGYVGSLDRMDFGEAEDVPGVAIYTVTRGEERPRVDVEHIPYPGARRYETIDLDEQPAPDVLEPGETVYRVRGTLTPDDHARIGTLVRSWRARGCIVSNQTTVAAEARARVDVSAEDALSREALVDRALEARPDLAEHKPAILEGLEEL